MLWPGAVIVAVRPLRLPRLAAKHNDLVTDPLCPVLIGRDAETARLGPAFAAAQGGAGGVMLDRKSVV